jgi:uncharacterized membrane protein
MDSGAVVGLSLFLGLIMFFIQRTEVKKRRLVTRLMVIVMALTLVWAILRQLIGSFILALVIALVLNFIFWLLIGRYNPVGSSDDIQVLGMDD